MNSNDKNIRDGYYDDDYNGSEESSFNQQDEQQISSIVDIDNSVNDEYSYGAVENPPDRRKNTKIKKKKHRILKFFIGIILLFIIISFGLSLFVPAKTNFLIMATDEDGTRTDTLMLATFDRHTKSISLISIPRDTYVTVTDDTFAKMKEEYPQPGSPSMKINAVHHFGGKKYGVSMIKNEVERLMGIDVDFYVKVDFDAFRYIIDSVGGIEFYVPQNMEYNDPYQNLYISLKEGNQRLSGVQAEHLLRYRSGYANADLGRIQVQQNFLKAFISQALSKRTILSNPGVYLNTVFKYDYIETNAGIFDIVSYALLISGINTDNMQSYTVPGYPDMAGGQSIYRPNVSEIANLVTEITKN